MEVNCNQNWFILGWRLSSEFSRNHMYMVYVPQCLHSLPLLPWLLFRALCPSVVSTSVQEQQGNEEAHPELQRLHGQNFFSSSFGALLNCLVILFLHMV